MGGRVAQKELLRECKRIVKRLRQTGFDPKEAGVVERGGVAAHLRPLAPEENPNAHERQWASVFGAVHVINVRERQCASVGVVTML